MLFSQFKVNRMAELFAEQWGAERIPGLLQLLNETCFPAHVLEIGSFRGVSTEVFLLHAKSVVAVDPWEDAAIKRDFEARCCPYPHLTQVQGYSPGACPRHQYTMVYIDGDHSYDAVMKDIVVAQSFLPRYIAGHDYAGVDTPGVKQAVDEYFGKPHRIFSDSSWLVRL